MSTKLDLKKYIGLTKDELPTPSLLLDMDLFEYNLNKMSQHSQKEGIDLRPHAKAHKCPEIAKRQIKAGAIGICVATINEAEAMVDAGIPNILITSEMVGKDKISRLVALTKRQPELMSVVDHHVHAEELQAYAHEANVMLNVLIDLDPGLNRTGIRPGEEAIKLAEKLMTLPNLKLKGIQCYSGRSAHIHGFKERKRHSHEAMRAGVETFHRLKALGYPMDVFTGGSTGTYNIDTELAGLTELQVGSYVFMDTDYALIGSQDEEIYHDFKVSLTILSTVVSKHHEGIATIDAGLKSMATDRSFQPVVTDYEGVSYQFSGDEHGRLEYEEAKVSLELGDRVEIIPPHCDPTINLYRHIFCIRDGKVEDVWPIVGKH